MFLKFCHREQVRQFRATVPPVSCVRLLGIVGIADFGPPPFLLILDVFETPSFCRT